MPVRVLASQSLCDIKFFMPASSDGSLTRSDLSAIASDAIRYWERNRPLYNTVLIVVVVVHFVSRLPAAAAAVTFDRSLGLFALAVLANVAYSAAYVPDVFAQLSDFRDRWRQLRWALFAVGCTFAAIMSRSIVLSTLDQL